MRLLLDTHIWIWSESQPERLTRKVAAALRDEGNELWLSPISVWEFLLLAEKGKLGVKGDPQAWVRQALRAAPLDEAPFTHEIAIESRRLDLPHGDPADRFLVATSRVLDLTLVTSDERILSTKSCRLLPNA